MNSNIRSLIDALTPHEENYLQVQGLRIIIQGLEYHYRNSINMNIKQTLDALHEITAYLGRLGQVYYFLKSDFMKVDANLIPRIESAIKYRMKYSAHRMVDAPRDGDILVDSCCIPMLKPYHPLTDDQRTLPLDMNLFMFGLQVQKRGPDGERTVDNFYIEDEHDEIMTEIEACLRRKLIQVKA